ncbi:MAG: hypothetical protein KDB33_11415, partial [Acidimicrobiales bacterium]|nr:hypothetical protein [Acidimicrobiales bacterium]
PPADDPYEVVAAAAALGPALVAAPSVATARRLGLRLRRAGEEVAVGGRDWARSRAGVTTIGARAAAFAPIPEPAAVVVLDEHDERYQEERAPTWHARDVLVERARRAGAPCLLVSPCPSLEALAAGPLVTPARAHERGGWPMLDVVDLRREDPMRSRLLSERLVDAVRSDARVVCILNRTGRARLLACERCRELARCERCEAAVAQAAAGEQLHCGRCGLDRPVVCQACGATTLRVVRSGVRRLRQDLEALTGRPVAEVTAASPEGAPTRVTVGTEAALHHLDAADVVAFVEFDQELLAPRYRAAEEAMALLALAARLVGGRRDGGRILVQTAMPEHDVVHAARLGDPGRLVEAERARRELLRLPPAAPVAVVSGAAAEAFVAAIDVPLGVEVSGPSADGQWLVRAADHDQLADLLAATPRPAGRLRLSVDPVRL